MKALATPQPLGYDQIGVFVNCKYPTLNLNSQRPSYIGFQAINKKSMQAIY